MLILTISSVFAAWTISAQVHSTDLQVNKYALIRKRLQRFIVPGVKSGEGLPFSSITPEGEEWVLHAGEATLMLGNYIAMLALEYEWNRRNGLDTQQQLNALYQSLFAINRLDIGAEQNEASHFIPRLDGFLIREDFPQGFFAAHSQQLNRRSKHFLYENSIPPSTKNKEEFTRGYDHRAHKYISHDHYLRILWGLQLIAKYIPVNIESHANSFQDGEKSICIEALRISDRIYNYFESVNWIIKRPDGVPVHRGSQVYIFKRELRRAHARVKKALSYERTIKGASFSKRRFHYGLLEKGILGMRNKNAWLNSRLQLESQNISGNYFKIDTRATQFGYETFIIPYGVLMHDWQIQAQDRERLKSKMLYYLKMMPCSGPYHLSTGLSSYGWATPDRTERPLEDTYFGIFRLGHFNGLDFLIIYNMYRLMFGEIDWYAVDIGDPCKRCDGNFSRVRALEWEQVGNRLEVSEKIYDSKLLNALTSECDQ